MRGQERRELARREEKKRAREALFISLSFAGGPFPPFRTHQHRCGWSPRGRARGAWWQGPWRLEEKCKRRKKKEGKEETCAREKSRKVMSKKERETRRKNSVSQNKTQIEKAALKRPSLFKGILPSSASSFQSASRSSSSHREAGARGVRETSARKRERERDEQGGAVKDSSGGEKRREGLKNDNVYLATRQRRRLGAQPALVR